MTNRVYYDENPGKPAQPEPRRTSAVAQPS